MIGFILAPWNWFSSSNFTPFFNIKRYYLVIFVRQAGFFSVCCLACEKLICRMRRFAFLSCNWLQGNCARWNLHFECLSLNIMRNSFFNCIMRRIFLYCFRQVHLISRSRLWRKSRQLLARWPIHYSISVPTLKCRCWYRGEGESFLIDKSEELDARRNLHGEKRKKKCFTHKKTLRYVRDKACLGNTRELLIKWLDQSCGQNNIKELHIECEARELTVTLCLFCNEKKARNANSSLPFGRHKRSSTGLKNVSYRIENETMIERSKPSFSFWKSSIFVVTVGLEVFWVL